ncbi:MAG: efflux RND transporter periplasmic adaptor subunit [Acidimicrobiia bacterium]|nr:efflux RND transporter periplasmic adaptor subunit [Acidimicrobiia bacterium]
MPSDAKQLDHDLNSLKIDRSRRRQPDGLSKWATRWILAGIALFVLLGLAATAFRFSSQAVEVEIYRVTAKVAADAGDDRGIVLNAAGYIVAHHKIQLTAKVVGKVAWIGVEKGDRVKESQVLVRLEDSEYQAQLLQAQGSLQNLLSQLQELESGSRPEEKARAAANLEQAKADLENARISLERTKGLFKDQVVPKQEYDNAQARHDAQQARVEALAKELELVRLGPRLEQIEAMRGRVRQARGEVALRQTFLDATIIRAPISGTILERAVEKGEFVTTSFVGERGAKGYVVSMADLNDLQVELDISQDDFAKLYMGQKAIVTTDAFPDRKYDGAIAEMSPEANRQKATVQVKVQISKPDEYLRPEMNARSAFLAREQAPSNAGSPPAAKIVIPTAAIRDSGGKKSIFIVFEGKATERPIKTGNSTSRGIEVAEGLIGGEEIVISPPTTLKDRDRVAVRTKRG